MVKGKIFSFLIALNLVVLTNFYGCNAKNTIEDASENVKQGSENLRNDAMDLVQKIQDTSMEYNKEDLKKDLDKKGLKVQKLDTTKPFFSVKGEDYKIVDGNLSVYEYEPGDKDKIINDLKTITENGTVINGTKVSWLKAPHIYKKGRIVAIYDGDNESVLTSLKEILGEPLLG